ncbi:protein GAMETOPHYTE DEFECTIVE 1 [Fagus crenata]
MGFFDLNIPYLESSPSDKTTFKATRTKVVIKAMELGYTGIAYNRTIKGVMSDHDRCSISLLTLSSLLKLVPSLSSSVNLHRDLLNVPRASPFRQYTRLTVCAENHSQALALNSGNPILKTYDLVAVKPLDQSVFDDACDKSEVDIIAIDFSERLPFRLKQLKVKAAIERGVYFEITYSDLITDVQARRQMISNAKLLVDWTRGRNLIFSSAAPSVNELRGPNDVANLSSLLGLSMERAKAAISKNCRTLIANALRKKQFYKEAIRVEAIPSGAQLDSNKPLAGDWFKWDPISSGEGDLLLEDMAKSFSASSKVSKTVKAIDFASVIGSMPSHGFQVKALITQTEAVPQPLDNRKISLSAAEIVEVPVAVSGLPEQLDSLDLPKSDQTLVYDTPLIHQASGCENSKNLHSPSDTAKGFTNSEEIRTPTTSSKVEKENPNGLDVNLALNVAEKHEMKLRKCFSSCESQIVLPNENVVFHASTQDLELDVACDADSKRELLIPSEDIGLPAPLNEESKSTKSSDEVLGIAMDGVSMEVDMTNQEDTCLALNDLPLPEPFLEREQFREPGNDVAILADHLPIPESHIEMTIIDDSSAANHESTEVTMEEKRHEEADTRGQNPTRSQSISGKSRQKRTSHRAVLFPLKRLLNPATFKKRTKKMKSGVKML